MFENGSLLRRQKKFRLDNVSKNYINGVFEHLESRMQPTLGTSPQPPSNTGIPALIPIQGKHSIYKMIKNKM